MISSSIMQKVEELLARIKSADDQIEKLTKLKSKLNAERKQIVDGLPMIYGKCIKELKCEHRNDNRCADDWEWEDDETIIEVNDIVKFFRYPVSKTITVNLASGGHFKVPFSSEYFEFFTADPDAHVLTKF